MKEVFLEDLPKKEGIGALKGKQVIDWNGSVGCKVGFVYEDINGIIEIIDYNPKNRKLLIKINNNVFYEKPIHVGNLINCRLGYYTEKTIKGFKVDLGILNSKNQSYKSLNIVDREYRFNTKNQKQKWCRYHCIDCGYESWIMESSLINGSGCACCTGKTAVLGINTIWDTDRWMCDLGVSEEDAKSHTKGSGKKITVKCPDCEKNKKIIICNLYKRKSIGCACGDKKSYISKYMYKTLCCIGVDFDTEVKFAWCNFNNKYKKTNSYGIYDFVIESKKIIIETDGALHRTDNKMNGQTKEESEHIDNMKDKLAKENGYKVIRITDEQDIKKTILDSELSNDLNLSNIDWLECEKFALSNRVKEVCDYWNAKDKTKTTKDAMNKFKLSRLTVINYLKKGTKFGWCDYDAKLEMKKIYSNNLKKPVNILKNGKIIMKFESISELIEHWYLNYGEKLNYTCISQICNKSNENRKTHKGYTFEFY